MLLQSNSSLVRTPVGAAQFKHRVRSFNIAFETRPAGFRTTRQHSTHAIVLTFANVEILTMPSPKVSPAAPEVLPMWKGRSGLINTVICGVVGFACAVGLLIFAERSTIIPACATYANTIGMTYSDFGLRSYKSSDRVYCILRNNQGATKSVYLNTLVPTATDWLVGFAVDIAINVLLFILLVAFVMSVPSLLAKRGKSP